MANSKTKNELIDTAKIRKLAQAKYRSLSKFGATVLDLRDREGISTRISNKRKITGDELIRIADGLGVSVDDLRIQ